MYKHAVNTQRSINAVLMARSDMQIRTLTCPHEPNFNATMWSAHFLENMMGG